MHNYLERNKLLRKINVLFFVIIGILMIQSKYIYGRHFYFNNIFIGIIILILIISFFLSSYYKKSELCYQRNMYFLLWIITIFTTYAAYIGEYTAVGAIQILLLSVCVFSIFNQKTMKIFTGIYVVSIIPIAIFCELGMVNKIVKLSAILGMLSMAYIKSKYEINIAKKLNEIFVEKKQIIDNAKEAFAIHEMVFDSKGKPFDYIFIDVNSAFENIIGSCKYTIINRTVLEIWPKTEKFWIDFYGNVVINKKAKKTTNYSGELKKFFEVSAYPIGEKGFGTLFFDVTKRVENDRKLKNLIEKMENTDQLKTKFLQDVNHRLRTPLNGMMGMMQLMNREDLGKENQEILEIMIKEMKHTKNIINQISQYVNIQSIECKYTKHNIKKIIERLVAPYQKRNFNISIIIDEICEEEEVFFEENILNKVCKELIKNAAKHTLYKKIEIYILCELDSEKLTHLYKIVVKDFGLGITKEEQKYIFNEFYHQDFINIYKEEEEICISMCKQMLEIIGGDLMFESEVGKGTMFTMHLPIYLTNEI